MIYEMLEIPQTFDLNMIVVTKVNKVRWFLCVAFYGGQELEFFMTTDDINDGNLFIFEGGVENIDDECSIIDGVDDYVVVVILAVDIDNGLKTSIFAISRFGNMFEFNDVFMVFCNLRW
jgi:hypothetical protein